MESTMDISIHTLRMEGDSSLSFALRPSAISIHTLRMEGDAFDAEVFPHCAEFQSTPSAWRVTAKAHKKTARFCSK